MSEKVIQVEELEGGLRAAFVNLPHFRTSSARLTINSGSLHEGDDTAGAAHFLEHITFQGTEGLPNDEVSRSYREENGLHINALTGPTETFYMSDGYDLRSVGYSVIQTALSPLLSKESLEKERKPIADEIRGYESNPYFHCNVSHNLAVGGERYARPITGSIEDVLKITHDQLKSYYDRNYRLGNAVLVICSSESIESQRDYAESLIAEVTHPETDQPTAVDLPVFNPKTEIASLQLVNLPLSAQTSLSIAYELPETSTLEEQLNHTLISNVLSKLVHRRLRGDLALCYDAQAHTNRLSNQYFDANRNWSTLMLPDSN
jgi:zinc protease